MPKKTPVRRHIQPRIYDVDGNRLTRESMTQAMHPDARADFTQMCAERGVSRSWAAAFIIETFMYGEGNTFAEDPGVSRHRRRKRVA